MQSLGPVHWKKIQEHRPIISLKLVKSDQERYTALTVAFIIIILSFNRICQVPNIPSVVLGKVSQKNHVKSLGVGG